MQPLLGEALIARDSHRLAESQALHRRLPSSKRAVSILQLWCTPTFTHVDARLALNQLFGTTEGNMAKKAKKAKAKKKTAKKKKK
jgi:hypothetical protein